MPEHPGAVARSLPVLAGFAAVGAATLAYASLVEPRRFTLRRATLPVLSPGSPTLTLLHISDLHITPGQRTKVSWVRGLADLGPDLVVNTGDTLAHPDAVPTALEALDGLLDRPGAFVMGNNDYYAPVIKSPRAYFDPGRDRRYGPPLPWQDLRDGFTHRGWADLDNLEARVPLAQGTVAAAGVDDTQLDRDRPEDVSGAADPTALLRLAVMHEPEPRLLDGFARDGYDLALAGHTHGGQVRLPLVGALVTNCDIDRAHARGTFPWPDPGGRMQVHVSAGLGASPYAPVRLLCPPEATLLTLVASGSEDRAADGEAERSGGYTGPASGM